MANQKITLNSLAAMEVQTAGYGAENAGYPGRGGQHGDQVRLEQVRARRGRLPRGQPAAALPGRRRAQPARHQHLLQPGHLRPHHQGQALVLLQPREPLSGAPTAAPIPPASTPSRRCCDYGNVRGTLKLTWQVIAAEQAADLHPGQPRVQQEPPRGLRRRPRGAAHARLVRLLHRHHLGVAAHRHPVLQDPGRLPALPAHRQARDVPRRAGRPASTSCPSSRASPAGSTTATTTPPTSCIDSGIEVVNTLEWFRNTKRFGDHAVKLVSRYFNRMYETADGVPGDMKTLLQRPDPRPPARVLLQRSPARAGPATASGCARAPATA